VSIYNEIDPFAAQWLRNLIDAGHLPRGTVSEHSIATLSPETVRNHVQAHFFAGIGVWSYALRQAGWPDDQPVWTGSCPCQPFSKAGRQKGFDDPRHLWPEWFRLIKECRPQVILGEQVASPDGLKWLDLVFADLERAGYACGAADLCAAGVGAPHIRQRLYFVAVSDVQRREELGLQLRSRQSRQEVSEARGGRQTGIVALTRGDKRRPRRGRDTVQGFAVSKRTTEQLAGRGDAGIVGDPLRAGLEGRRPGVRSGSRDAACPREEIAAVGAGVLGPWAPADWLPCLDGKSRPVEPGTFPLAHGVTGRVGKLRAYGNALCAPVAVTFVKAVMQALGESGD
jgi:DNA (cytosine-5)-methyltransferase 1